MANHVDDIRKIFTLLESSVDQTGDTLNQEQVQECSCGLMDDHMHMDQHVCPVHGVVHVDHDMDHHDMDHHDGYSKDVDGYEGKMSKSRLYKLANYAAKLHNMIHNDENLEPWVQDKITKAEDYISTIFHYLEYEKLTEDKKKS